MSNLADSAKAKGLSIILIAVFAISTISTITQVAAAQPDRLPDTYTIEWRKESPQDTDNWTWTSIEWLYGPSMSIDIAYINGTSLISTTGGLPGHYLYPGLEFYVNITVPKSLLELGRNMSQVFFNMNKYQSYWNGSQYIGLWSASIDMSYVAYPMQDSGGKGGYLISDPWNFQSSFWNYSTAGYGSSSGMGYPSGPPVQPPAFFMPNRVACKYFETEECYYVWFQGRINSTMSTAGTFMYSFSAMDTKGSVVSTKGQYGGNLVVIEPDPSYTYACDGDYTAYYAYVTGLDGKKTNLVNPGTQFKVVIDFTGLTANVKNLSIILPPPVDWSWWEDPLKNTGNLQQYQMFTDLGWFYNYTSSSWEYISQDYCASRRVKLVWTNAFGGSLWIDEGFEYWKNSGPDWANLSRILMVDSPGSSHFYELNVTASDKNLADNRLEFVVKILDTANASAGSYYFDAEGYKDESRMYGYGSWEFRILGDNVVKVALLKLGSREPIARILPDKYFQAVIEIVGTQYFGTIVLTETTNVTFVFSSPRNCRWWSIGDLDYSSESYLQFVITRDTKFGHIDIEVFNYTSSGWNNRVTCESNYTYLQDKLDENDYVKMGSLIPPSYNVTSNILTLILSLNFTAKAPQGCYSWDAYIANWTGSYYDYYEWSGDMALHYTKLRVPDSWNILVGNVDSYWYMHSSQQAWNTDPYNGAVDFDGDNMTKSDQFYVKRIYTSTSYWTMSGTRMFVDVSWGTYHMNSYFALMDYSWRYEWSEVFIWYYPSNRSIVPHDRFEALVNSTIWDLEANIPKPEYSQISQLTLNRTWERIKSESSQYSWWKEEYNWYWLEINFNQNFFTPDQFGGSSNNLFFQYAGLLLFNDTNNDGVLNMGFENGIPEAQELTHYFMFEQAKGMQLTTPFAGDNGTVQVNINDDVSWGVSVQGLNGTTYPTQIRGYGGFAGLDWWWHDSYGMYMTDGNFSTIPSRAGINNLDFTAHFEIPNANLTKGAVNEIRVKIDEGVGAWTLYDRPQSELQDYSMAIAFLASSSNWQYSFKTNTGKDIPSDSGSELSDTYNITKDGVKLADIQMGGSYYTWGKDLQNHTMHSSTTPMSAFTAMYSAYSMTGKGQSSISSFSMMGSNYFMTSAFIQWDGYSVYTDPYFAVFQSSSGQEGPGGGFGGVPPLLLIGIASAAIVAVSAFVMVKKRKSAVPSVSQKEDEIQVP